jgi:uncharacterized SAM-binding protein YcdF (DUF218 family)
MLDLIKESIQLIHFFFLGFLLLVVRTYHLDFKKMRWWWIAFLLVFLVFSTHKIPAQLLATVEGKTPVFQPKTADARKTYYLHVLGAGYSLDPRLPATSQLHTTTLARLVEAVRISRYLPHFKIVGSGYSRLGLESQAAVVKRAAIALGVPSERCKILSSPSTTAEEVHAFAAAFGTHRNVIVVSDALHLPRALMLYEKAGINAMGAPTNFKVKQGPNDSHGFCVPSLASIDLLDAYLREQAKYWKDTF